MRELCVNEIDTVAGGVMALPGECSTATLAGATFAGAIGGAFGGIAGGPAGMFGGAVFGGALGAAGAAFGCAWALM